jgi:hypothetical protein
MIMDAGYPRSVYLKETAMEIYRNFELLHLAEDIRSAKSIQIISGDDCGDGTTEEYTGIRSLAKVRSALRHERCEGSRWAYLIIDGEFRREI